ncbi:hypothetical protein ACJZ2D_009918 [Fusarium nematophilum]
MCARVLTAAAGLSPFSDWSPCARWLQHGTARCLASQVTSAIQNKTEAAGDPGTHIDHDLLTMPGGEIAARRSIATFLAVALGAASDTTSAVP